MQKKLSKVTGIMLSMILFLILSAGSGIQVYAETDPIDITVPRPRLGNVTCIAGDKSVTLTVNPDPGFTYIYNVMDATEAAAQGVAFSDMESMQLNSPYDYVLNGYYYDDERTGYFHILTSSDVITMCDDFTQSSMPSETFQSGRTYWIMVTAIPDKYLSEKHYSAGILFSVTFPDENNSAAEPSNHTASATDAQSEPEPEKLLVNEVHHHNGKVTGPVLDGIYNSSTVKGCVITTPLSDLETLAGLTSEQKEDGAQLKYYICDSRPSKTKTLLTETVAQSDYKLASIINADLYLLQKGTVTPIKGLNQKIQIEIGIPQTLQKEGRQFSIICFDSNGQKIVMNDLDNDPKSITIDTNVFGLFAICYQD